MSFEDFQAARHGDYLGYLNVLILTILNLHVAPMLSTKFGLNLTLGSRADAAILYSQM